MKYALISEEQIKQLSLHVRYLKFVDPVATFVANEILKSLKPSDHVAWMKDKELTFKPPFRGHTEGWVKLYALDEVTK